MKVKLQLICNVDLPEQLAKDFNARQEADICYDFHDRYPLDVDAVTKAIMEQFPQSDPDSWEFLDENS